jgi:hypothetical protein
MSFTSCSSFSIDFTNIAFEIYIPMNNQTKFRLPTKAEFGSNEIIVDKSESTYGNLPMMFIDTKNSSSTTKSLILVEKLIDSSSIQTANVTVIFNHRVSNQISKGKFRTLCNLS